MLKLPTLPESRTSMQMVDTFYGYNHNMKIGEGEFYGMKNLTSDYYPLLASRAKRSTVRQLDSPRALLGKSKLAYIDGSSLYYGEQDLTPHLQGKGFTISDREEMLPKQLVSMGAYIVIYPDKLYINTENYEDCGSIEAKFFTSEGTPVEFTICTIDGAEYGEPVASATAPSSPASGALWLDTSSDVHALKQYNGGTGMWVDIATVYTKIRYPGIGKLFSEYDGVTIEGVVPGDVGSAMTKQLEALNGSHIIYAKGDDYIVVVGLLDRVHTQTTGRVTVSRTMPDMDFITESENRLWGCKYGLVNGETVNEIYCCALGDFKNWNRFLGIATDSYVASVGTDGPWTGAVTHLGYPVFFKENCLHKVYISATGAHQIVDTACRGVQKGSHGSLQVVNERLYYKAVTDVMMYDGSLPQSVSNGLGTERYFDAVAGSIGDKYYVSMKDAGGDWHLFVYDSLKALWHREDNTQALDFARCGGALYFIDGKTVDNKKALVCVNGSEGVEEPAIDWMAESGLIGYTTVERKYISRLNLRMRLPVGSTANVYIQYNSDGQWHSAGKMVGRGTDSFMLPLRPRRCDHFRIRLEGCGEVRLYSIAKILEEGSDVT